ncbi:translesion DNA synthesis-associated protein ImuA [Thaumasiovibrio sp. DFM-14]|uniref:translesion DNA synthesis-associated protein ImuA n=1 Tax=Thaumasiovibrio sp. DFM-14 TaxID=3384792 RepID=UPI0039A1ADEC
MHEVIELLQRKNLIWRGGNVLPTPTTHSTGFSSLDSCLAGGFPRHGVIDVRSTTGVGELRLLFPYLSACGKQRLVAFIGAPYQINAASLRHSGFDLNQILLLSPLSKQDALWAAEQCLKSGACGAVLLWHQEIEVHQVRRFHMASEIGGCLQFLLRDSQQHLASLPVSLSLNVSAHPRGLNIDVLKRKGGWINKSLLVDMTGRWPSLTLPESETRVIPFPLQHTVFGGQ